MKHYIPLNTEDLIKTGNLSSIRDFDPDNTYLDIIIISGDAFIDHPSFGAAIIVRTLMDKGFKVGVIAQPDWKSQKDFKKLGRPKLFFGITSGNIDSMLHHYTANKKLRHDDPYTENGEYGKRPNRAVIVYSNSVKSAYKGIPVVIGGIEASLRRFAHYDYWDDRVRRSILFDSRADLLVYGPGERQIIETALKLKSGKTMKDITDIAGTAFITDENGIRKLPSGQIRFLDSYENVSANKSVFADNFARITEEQNPYFGKILIQPHQNRFLVVNPPVMPLSENEIDHIYALPYSRKPHPSYKQRIPAFETTQWSVVSHRGCYGGCSFCAIYYHQGPVIQSRSENSILREIDKISADKDFKGTITDLGGPSANMYKTDCRRKLRQTTCKKQSCLHPVICPNLETSHTPIIKLWKKIELNPKIKHLFVASGIRFDLALRHPAYLDKLIRKHVGGHLKVAPEHTVPHVLKLMRKPPIEIFSKFVRYFMKVRNKKQFLVSYMISSHPGCTYEDMLNAKKFLDKNNLKVEQVQDFIPLPMTEAGVMYHTGINPFTKEKVFVEKSAAGKLKQRYVLTPPADKKHNNRSKNKKQVNRSKTKKYGKSLKKHFKNKNIR